jgi:short-subunit dehydrogenase
MKNFRLALVTGASCGLGKALSEALASRGIPLLLAARRKDQLQDVARRLAVPTQIYPVDLADPQERAAFLQWLSEQTPDLVINNAGSGLYGPALLHPTIDQSRQVELNVQALLEITFHCIYAAGKTFINQFSQSLDFELKEQNIRILTSCPGKIDTEFSMRASGNLHYRKKAFLTMSPEKAVHLILKQIDRGRALEVIDFRYKCLVALSKILPKSLLMRFMNNSVQSYFSPKLEK